MKKNMITVMNRLKIDEGIRPLIGQLWKHCYRTFNSCRGHGGRAYVMFTGGDGWFENNSQGFSEVKNGDCCDRQLEEFSEEIRSHCLNPQDFEYDVKSCSACGAGVNGYRVYERR